MTQSIVSANCCVTFGVDLHAAMGGSALLTVFARLDDMSQSSTASEWRFRNWVCLPCCALFVQRLVTDEGLRGPGKIPPLAMERGTLTQPCGVKPKCGSGPTASPVRTRERFRFYSGCNDKRRNAKPHITALCRSHGRAAACMWLLQP